MAVMTEDTVDMVEEPIGDYDPRLDTGSEDFDEALAQLAAGAPTFEQEEQGQPEKRFFEGKPVEATQIKITGVSGLDERYNGVEISLHDRVRLVVEARVTRVSHGLDKDSRIVRLQELKATQVDIVPWNPMDETDDGILRDV